MPFALATRTSTTLFSLALLLTLCGTLPQTASAQDTPTQQKIRIFEQNDICVYDIEDHAAQDTFRIAPKGVVLFKTEGDLEANVEIKDDPKTNVSGTQGRKSAMLRGGQDIQVLVVRLAQGQNSEHKVDIQCCMSKNADGSCVWTPVQDANPDSRGALETDTRPFGSGFAHRSGPNAPAASTPGENGPVETGGPTMEVEEDE